MHGTRIGTLHLSVDDVTACLRELGDADHATPWTQPTFAYLRELHERAGVVVSLFAFLEDGAWRLEDVPTRHRAAFEGASSWLRFGFHGLDAATAYGAGGAPVADARDHYDRFVAAVRGFAGPRGDRPAAARPPLPGPARGGARLARRRRRGWWGS